VQIQGDRCLSRTVVTSQVQKKEKEIEAMMVLLGIEAQGSRKIKNQ